METGDNGRHVHAISQTMKRFIPILGYLIIILVSYRPIVDADMYLGVATGSYILNTHTIPLREVFSWSAQGRPMIPYEWLSQTGIALLYRLGGVPALSIGVATLFATTVWCFFSLTRRRGHPVLQSIAITAAISVLIYPFFTARPYVVGITLFMATLLMVDASLIGSLAPRRWILWATIPLVYLWSNMHTSYLFAPYLFLAYAIYERTQHRNDRARLLATIGGLQILTTFLPPLSYRSYELFWQIIRDMRFIRVFYEEWKPIFEYPNYMTLYVGTLAAAIIIIKINNRFTLLIALLIPFLIAPFTALRHLPWGLLTIGIITVIHMKPIRTPSKMWVSMTLTLLLSILVIGYAQKQSLAEANWHLPYTALAFLKSHNLKGRMFNDMPVGGFLNAELYPQYQTYFDGRAEVFGGHEHREYYALTQKKHASRDVFRTAVYEFVNTNAFSYLIIPTSSYNPMEFSTAGHIADILSFDPDWRLVYVSDMMRIMVKRDGKNDGIFASLGMSFITPYQLQQYRKGKEKEAVTEYLRMITLKDSGISQSGLGQAYLALGDLNQAQESFLQATRLNPRLGRPYLGLAKLARIQHDNAKAISHLRKSLAISPYLGESYLLLAELLGESGKQQEAIQTLEQGLNENIDLITRQKIVQAISIYSKNGNK